MSARSAVPVEGELGRRESGVMVAGSSVQSRSAAAGAAGWTVA